MGLFGLGKKKKKEESKVISPLPLESEKKQVDDLDLPPFPSEQQVDLEQAKEHEKEAMHSKVPNELPPIEDVPNYDEEFVPMPETIHEETEKEKPMPTQTKPPESFKPEEPKIEPEVHPAIKHAQQNKIMYPQTQEQPTKPKAKGPLFIKMANYKNILSEISNMKSRLNESLKTISRIKEIKNPEDSEFNKWKETLEDIQRKILYVDKTLFEKL